jgi:hypothetical protein
MALTIQFESNIKIACKVCNADLEITEESNYMARTGKKFMVAPCPNCINKVGQVHDLLEKIKLIFYDETGGPK